MLLLSPPSLVGGAALLLRLWVVLFSSFLLWGGAAFSPPPSHLPPHPLQLLSALLLPFLLSVFPPPPWAGAAPGPRRLICHFVSFFHRLFHVCVLFPCHLSFSFSCSTCTLFIYCLFILHVFSSCFLFLSFLVHFIFSSFFIVIIIFMFLFFSFRFPFLKKENRVEALPTHLPKKSRSRTPLHSLPSLPRAKKVANSLVTGFPAPKLPLFPFLGTFGPFFVLLSRTNHAFRVRGESGFCHQRFHCQVRSTNMSKSTKNETEARLPTKKKALISLLGWSSLFCSECQDSSKRTDFLGEQGGHADALSRFLPFLEALWYPQSASRFVQSRAPLV